MTKTVRIALKSLAALLTLTILLAGSLYIPAVQDFIVPRALERLNAGSDTIYAVERLRLRFPLDLTLTDAAMIAGGDTTVAVQHVRADVALLPLLRGDISLNEAHVTHARYSQGAPDSALCMTARLSDARLSGGLVNLVSHSIDIKRLTADGITVDMTLLNDTTQTPPDTAQADWCIHAREIALTDVDYRMRMLPSIDTLQACISSARLTGGDVSLASRSVCFDSLDIDSVSARYLLPDATYTASHPTDTVAATVSQTPSQPWTIKGKSITLTNSDALYAVSGTSPQPGLDTGYIQVSGVNISIDSLYNRGTELRVPLRRLTATERCGLSLSASGTFAMDSTNINVSQFGISTTHSHIDLDATAGLSSSSAADMPLRIRTTASIGLRDIISAMPSLTPMLANMPHDDDITADIDIDGSISDLTIGNATLELRDCFALSLKGHITDITDMNLTAGNISVKGSIRDGDMLKPTLLRAKSGTDINIPPLSLQGNIKADSGVWSGDIKAVTHGGTLALDGHWKARASSYSGNLDLHSFPVNSFMPALGAGKVTARLSATGHGYDPMSASTTLSARVEVTDAIYLKHDYTHITADITLAGGNADIRLDSQNAPADFTVTATGNLAGKSYVWDVDADVRHLDLLAIGLSDSVANGSVRMGVRMALTPADHSVTADLNVNRLSWQQGSMILTDESAELNLSSCDTLTDTRLVNRDLTVSFTSPSGYDSLSAALTRTMTVMDSIVATRRLDATALQHAMPRMRLNFNAGRRNALHAIMSGYGMAFDSLATSLTNDSLISLDASMLAFASGQTKLDTITARINQKGNSLIYNLSADNRPGTLDGFAHVTANGFVTGERLAVMLRQRDIAGRTGYAAGLQAHIDSLNNITLQLVPANPVIAYKNWSVNDGNFITFNMRDRHFAADLEMKNSESRIHIFTGDADTPDLSVAGAPQQDVNVNISDVKIADWISFSPFAPPVKGDLSAALKLSFADNSVNGKGSARLDNFHYGKQSVGSFDLGLDLTTMPRRALKADISLDINGLRAITASGILNDSTAATPMNIDLTVDRLPLNIINPFMPAGTASLTGSLNGAIKATGRITEPVLDGWLAFDSTAVRAAMTGTDYRFSDSHIPISANRILFDTFTITGTNANPLTINGVVDASSLTAPRIDLHLLASDFGVVNTSRRTKGATVYGRAYADLDAKIKGTMSLLNINAAVNLLPGTNVTYALDTDVTTLTSQRDNDMVRFVNFNDTATIAKADTIAASSMMMNLDALLTVSDGSTVNVDLSPDGKNKASVKSAGVLNMHIDPMGDMRLTGRLNINEGFVRYTPPFMSEKLFNFNEGSYVAFNGDMMNPLLNIHAVDRLRANVTQEGQNSRLIYFDIALNVTGSLNDMDVSFDLSTDDDITVQNELQSMTPEQRANQAMNLLLYNMYTGKGTSASSSLSGNMLYSFLASQLNNWAANNIKGVDISFGIDQYDRTVDGNTSQTTSYSYRVSKSLFNDRFKIVIGGNYSTDADADENFAQNLVNDISFEYLLNRAGTMYVKIFRHTGYESILEGEITQTGVGFVYKRKMRRIAEMFRRVNDDTPLPVQDNESLNPIKPEAFKRNDDDTTK